MDRIRIKERARDLAGKHLSDFWKGYIIIFAINFFMTFILNHTMDSNNPMYSLVNLLFTLITAPLSVGLTYYILNIVRGKKFELNDIFKQFQFFLPILIINMLTTIFVMLWSILFIIPGIIAMISYSMTFFIFVDGEQEPMECIRKSKEMLQGYKGDFFIFGLSFFGWILLGAVTLGLLYIWLMPYIQFATAIYYDDLKKLRAKDTKKDEVKEAEIVVKEEKVEEEKPKKVTPKKTTSTKKKTTKKDLTK